MRTCITPLDTVVNRRSTARVDNTEPVVLCGKEARYTDGIFARCGDHATEINRDAGGQMIVDFNYDPEWDHPDYMSGDSLT